MYRRSRDHPNKSLLVALAVAALAVSGLVSGCGGAKAASPVDDLVAIAAISRPAQSDLRAATDLMQPSVKMSVEKRIKRLHGYTRHALKALPAARQNLDQLDLKTQIGQEFRRLTTRVLIREELAFRHLRQSNNFVRWGREINSSNDAARRAYAKFMSSLSSGDQAKLLAEARRWASTPQGAAVQ